MISDRLLLSDGSFTSDECKIANAFSEEFLSNYSYGCGSDSQLSFASRTTEHSEDSLFDYNTVVQKTRLLALIVYLVDFIVH